MGRTRHAQIGHKAKPLGQHLGVGGGHVGVGAPERLGAPVQIPGHSPLFAGGFGVKVYQHHVGAHALQGPVGRGEGIFKITVHLAPADQVEHPDAQPLRAVVHAPAAAGDPAGIVGRTQGIAVVLQKVRDLDAVPGVVAQSDHVRPRVKDGPGLPGQDAHAGGVFAVDDRKVDVFQLFQRPQVLAQIVQTAVAHYVAHSQYVQDHGAPPLPASAEQGPPARTLPGKPYGRCSLRRFTGYYYM